VIAIGTGGSPAAIPVIDWESAQGAGASPVQPLEPGLADDESDA
jgi:hypothetical protein